MKSFGLQYENAFLQSAALAKLAGDNTTLFSCSSFGRKLSRSSKQDAFHL